MDPNIINIKEVEKGLFLFFRLIKRRDGLLVSLKCKILREGNSRNIPLSIFFLVWTYETPRVTFLLYLHSYLFYCKLVLLWIEQL